MSLPHLIQLERGARWPSHTFVDNRDEFANLATPGDIGLANAVESLLRRVEVFEEDHDGPREIFGLDGIGYYVQVQPEIVLLANGHVVPDNFDGYAKITIYRRIHRMVTYSTPVHSPVYACPGALSCSGG